MITPARLPLLRLLSGSLLGRAAGAVCGLLLQVAIARLLGVDQSGLIYTSITLVALFGIVAKFGLDTDLLRRAGADWHAGRLPAVAHAYGSALATASGAGLLAAVGLYLAADHLSALLFGSDTGGNLLRILAPAIPVYAIICMQAAILKAIDRPGAAALLEVALVPAGAVAFSLAAHATTGLSAEGVGAAHLAGTILTALIGASWVRAPGRPLIAGLRAPRLARGGRNLAGVELLNFALASAALPVVSTLAGATEAGLFNAAMRLATQVGMIGLIVGGLLAPRFAALHRDNAGPEALSRLAQQGTLMMCALALPALAVLFVWPQGALLLFGSEFAGLETPLRILALGQLANMLTGPAGFLLVMTGHERDLRDILLATTAVTLPLTAGLALTFGADGAAWATTVGLALQNLAAARRVYERLGVHMLPAVRPFARTSAAALPAVSGGPNP